ncbi:MAG: 4a-hydroxytetrahydrobiopterin dehydratase [Solirubrobacteraceae bacterium]|nr:4a-hydroxytetrahydrobiopterin dehydratase [Solirubrobacteraceae bacterium]
MPDVIDEDRLRAWAAEHGWDVVDGGLERDRTFADFAGALAHVVAVGALAEERDHHPDLHLHGWNHVRVRLVTHSVGGVTDLDVALATAIDGLVDGSGGAA